MTPDPEVPAAGAQPAPARPGRSTFLLRWTVATAVGGAVVGALEGGGSRLGASLLLPGLATGAAQQLVAPRTVPGVWALISAFAWLAGGLVDAWLGASAALPPVAIWLLPTAAMALWQAPLLGPIRRTWLWFPVATAAAPLAQVVSRAACTAACDTALAWAGPPGAGATAYLAGFAAYGLVTGALLARLRGRPA